MADRPASVSVVVPVYNEVDNLRILHGSLTAALSRREYSLVFVDDGSSDGSLSVLSELAVEDPEHVRLVELRRNFGQTAAIAAGIDHSDGEIIVLIDADMQNDPADIPNMLEKIEQGYDVVSGWRVDRQDRLLTRKIPSRAANWLISRVTGVKLHDYGCTLKAYRREVLQGFRLYGEMHRFIPAYAGSVGARIIEMPVRHHPRLHGKTKYGLERTTKVLLDLFTVKFLISYAVKPIYLFGGTGIALILPSLGVLLFLLVRRLTIGTAVLSSPLFQTSTMLIILGFQSILMGFIAELLVRTYHESQAKPTYSIRRTLNIPSPSE
ncbi:MAG TPA: glycosyltransferase family 2 protein [Anaerolineales bacterium]|jgi:glycosyltransferase involved in cell wall biosynthesis|nr:glycosyltransferase family 2 protein [Anaerolineales bacterium]